MLPKGNTVNFSHFFFTFIAKTVFESLFLVFIVAALVFSQSIYSNIKSK